jgi:hypothetical protein
MGFDLTCLHTCCLQVAEKLANEAVKPSRQVQIVEYGGEYEIPPGGVLA